jgi:hypothetical protein
MKDFIQFVLLMALIFGLMAAVPVLGVVVGVGLGVWFLWNAWKEERNVNG